MRARFTQLHHLCAFALRGAPLSLLLTRVKTVNAITRFGGDFNCGIIKETGLFGPCASNLYEQKIHNLIEHVFRERCNCIILSPRSEYTKYFVQTEIIFCKIIATYLTISNSSQTFTVTFNEIISRWAMYLFIAREIHERVRFGPPTRLFRERA